MKTPFDFASVLLFAVLAVIYLHRSSKDERDRVPLWGYGIIALACAAGDVLANRGYMALGTISLLVAMAGTAWVALRGQQGAGKA